MSKFRSILALVMALSILLLAGCGTIDNPTSSATPTPSASSPSQGSQPTDAPNKSGAYKIGIASREITNDFNRDIISNAQAVIEAAGGTVVSTDAQADPQKHNENIENLINSGIDGLIVQLGDPQQLAPIMAKAKEKGIPVVTAGVGSPVPDT
ncbi:MAG TPA: substrate-binding domain-containing protein, partial [Thermoclostridium sp.]|nr:substrate-binding domain-containing protein [Thermoclostridium sp.]